MPLLHQRKLKTIKEFSSYRQEQLESDRFTLFRSRAKFIDPDTIELSDGILLTADHFMVATGSKVATPPVPGLASVPYWTSDDILELDFLPKKVIVLGGGIVACELAQFLRRAGSEVVMIQRSGSILGQASPEASSTVAKQLRKEGIDLYTDTAIRSISHQRGKYEVSFEHKGETLTVHGPHLLNTLGRRPATEGIGLDLAGVELNAKGQIACNELQQTSNPKIYACGDVAGPHEIVHIAILQGELAARHATGRPAEPVNYDTLLGVFFTDPQIGQVGLSETELQARGIDYVAADYPFRRPRQVHPHGSQSRLRQSARLPAKPVSSSAPNASAKTPAS